MSSTIEKTASSTSVTAEQEDNACCICYDENPDPLCECQSCHAKYCQRCFLQCITSKPDSEVHCQNCDTLYPVNIVAKIYGIEKWHSDYISMLVDIKLKVIKQRIPEFMHLVSIYVHFDNLGKDIMRQARHAYELFRRRVKSGEEVNRESLTKLYNDSIEADKDTTALTEMYHLLMDNFNDDELNELTSSRRGRYSGVWYSVWYSSITKFAERLYHDLHSGIPKYTHYTNIYTFPCSESNCNGYIDKDGICSVCKTHFCTNCMEKLTKEQVEYAKTHKKTGLSTSTQEAEPATEPGDPNIHKCKPETLETIKSIKESTKPCPTCKARIFKISGCSQMFCTHCHASFDWNTGHIITGNFHNPHRIEWLRSIGFSNQNPEAINYGCTDIERAIRILYRNIKQFMLDKNDLDNLCGYDYLKNHVRFTNRRYHEIITQYRNFDTATHLEHILKYIIYNDSSFIMFLRKETIRYQKALILTRILDDFVETITMVLQTIDKNNVLEVLEMCYQIVEHANDQLEDYTQSFSLIKDRYLPSHKSNVQFLSDYNDDLCIDL